VSDERNIDQLTPQEVKRLIVRLGGLWSGYALQEEIDKRARYWTRKPGFPMAVWQVGVVKLYDGRSVQRWMSENGYQSAAEYLAQRIDSMNRVSFQLGLENG
jgi:hypothetical protein